MSPTTLEHEHDQHVGGLSFQPQMDVSKMPGHWILARLGKRVLRPGGLELTYWLLKELAIDHQDQVVEFAPGMGRTAQIVLAKNPASYTAVERDADAAAVVHRWLPKDTSGRQVMTGQAQATGLPDACATKVYGEAMLTMQPETRRRQIIAEAYRLLKPGGCYGIHEMSLAGVDAHDEEEIKSIRKQMTTAIHHQAYPMLVEGWKAMLEDAGFEVEAYHTVPMALLEPKRVIQDEGWYGSLRFVGRLAVRPPERKRVLEMGKVFRSLRSHLGAIGILARKPA